MDPVFRSDEDGLWYFYNETWSDTYGPYWSKEEANQACKEYAESL